MISAVNAFSAVNTSYKLEADTLSQSGENVTGHQRYGCFHPKQYCSHLDKVATELIWHFSELEAMDNIAAFVTNPFLVIEVLGLPKGADIEMIDLQNDLAVCSYEPNYKVLTDSVQSQPSH